MNAATLELAIALARSQQAEARYFLAVATEQSEAAILETAYAASTARDLYVSAANHAALIRQIAADADNADKADFVAGPSTDD